MSSYDNEKVDMLNIIEKNYPRDLEENDLLARYVHKLLTFELMPLDEKQIEKEMQAYQPFQNDTEN